MDPNFYRTELYERERRKDEMRQAEKARLARLARSDEDNNQHQNTGRLRSGFGRVLTGLGTRLFQWGSHMTGSNVSDSHSDPCLELNSSSSPGAV